MSIEPLAALAIACAEMERRLRLVSADQWDGPTPCDEWDVRALVNHVVGANRRYVMLLAGATAAEVDTTRAVDHIGDDAVAAFRSTSADLSAAFAVAGALDRVCRHPVGDRTGAELLEMRILDVAVHAWDLARALGDDEELDPVLVDHLLAATIDLDASRRSGSFADPAGAVPADAPSLVRLLHRCGRLPTTEEAP